MKNKLGPLSLSLLIPASLACTHANAALAAGGTWTYDSSGWQYERQDGSRPKTTWEQVDGKWYHFNERSRMDTGWYFDGTAWFYLNEDGSMRTGWLCSEGKWYWLNGIGRMVTGWQYLDDSWHFFCPDGAMYTGWLLVNETWYHLDDFSGAMSRDTWLNYGSEWYYLRSDGSAATGWAQLGDDWFFFDREGRMKHDAWEGDYYLLSSGHMAKSTWIGSYFVGSDGCWRQEANDLGRMRDIFIAEHSSLEYALATDIRLASTTYEMAMGYGDYAKRYKRLVNEMYAYMGGLGELDAEGLAISKANHEAQLKAEKDAKVEEYRGYHAIGWILRVHLSMIQIDWCRSRYDELIVMI